MILHHVTDMNWLHTHGLAELGLPELEIWDIPVFLVEPAVKLLKEVGNYMQNRNTGCEVGIVSPSRTGLFELVKGNAIPGSEDYYEEERWQLVDVEPSCECCGLKAHEKS